MMYANHISSMNELSASEGVFTTAQAARLGITRNALAHACAVGRAERICHGAYRLTGTPALETDELTAIWKLTKPSLFTWERQRTWDGIAIGGHTAACLLGIGDFFSTPYRIFSPARINSRLISTSFGIRAIDRQDVSWMLGLPVTRPERTLVDLCLDFEDPSLIGNAFRDASARGLDLHRLEDLVQGIAKTPQKRRLLMPLKKHILAAREERNS